MKRTMLLCGALGALAGPTFAADMPIKAPPVAVSYYNWTGFYAGVNAGYGVARDPTTLTVLDPGFAGPLDHSSFKVAPAGILGGAQVGYNWQAANWVVGLEADFQGTGQKDSACVQACTGGLVTTVEQKLPWFGTVRGRLGYAVDRSLFYVTGGLAYGKVETNVAETNTAGAPGTAVASASSTKTGFALGGGIESALAGNWTMKVEYLYVDLGSQTVSFSDTVAPRTDIVTASFRNNVIRAGVNYRFGDRAAGMPARAPDAAGPAYRWTGIYLGLNAGYGAANDPTTYNRGVTSFNQTFAMSPAGAIGGAQVGYNWQMASWVAGLEADLQATGQKDSVCVLHCALPINAFSANVEQKLPWFGTARGRLGYAAGRPLFYVTGGLAYGKVETNVVQTVVTTVSGSTSETKTGWTVGGGIEAPLAGNWTAKAEYLYVDLGSQTVTFATPVVTTVTSSVRNNIFRAGINYKL